MDDTNKLFIRKSTGKEVFITPVKNEDIGEFHVGIEIRLDHPNVNSIADVFYDHTEVLFVSPAVKCTLETVIAKIRVGVDLPLIREIMTGILKELDYLHFNSVSH